MQSKARQRRTAVHIRGPLGRALPIVIRASSAAGVGGAGSGDDGRSGPASRSGKEPRLVAATRQSRLAAATILTTGVTSTSWADRGRESVIALPVSTGPCRSRLRFYIVWGVGVGKGGYRIQ